MIIDEVGQKRKILSVCRCLQSLYTIEKRGKKLVAQIGTGRETKYGERSPRFAQRAATTTSGFVRKVPYFSEFVVQLV